MKDVKTVAAATHLAEWARDNKQPGDFACAEHDGVVVVVGRDNAATLLKLWVEGRGGRAQKIKNPRRIRSTTTTESRATEREDTPAHGTSH